MNMEQHLVESVGWTLVHSLWQGAAIFGLLFLAARSLGTGAAQYRYAGWIAALVLVIVSSIATFLLVYGIGPGVVISFSGNTIPASIDVAPSISKEFAIAQGVLAWIDLNLLWVIRLWLIGSIALLLKMLSGILYISFLRKSALPVAAEWEEKANRLARGLQITRIISIAEGRVSTPMIVGYLKPLIVFPVGMMAGLAPQQVEAILIHELAHIRRHDFIVNVVQCIVESLFFFNPFVWMISARIRMEREHCCDDLVLHAGIEPLVYVRTLASVEVACANGGRLSLGLMGQRHQLLNRMKRVMEKTVVKKEWNGIRLLPLSLVLVGLVCASWLSVGLDAEPGIVNSGPSIVAMDTTISNDTFRAEPYPGEDEELIWDDADSYTESFSAIWVPPFDPSTGILSHPTPSFHYFNGDSIPGFPYMAPTGDWDKFEKEFTARFRDQFPKFFDKNREQFEKLMQEFGEQNEEMGLLFRRMDELHLEELGALDEQMALINPSLQNLENFTLPIPREEDMRALIEADEALAQSARALAESQMFLAQEEMMKAQELFMLDQEDSFRAYENELIDQLTRDGYVKDGEKVKDIHINNGEVTVNGKKVKKEDEAKYRAIIDRHNNRMHAPRKPE